MKKHNQLLLLLTAVCVLAATAVSDRLIAQEKPAASSNSDKQSSPPTPAQPAQQDAATATLLAEKDAQIKLRDAHIQWLNQKIAQLQSKLNGLQMYFVADESLMQLEASKPAPIVAPTTPTTPTTPSDVVKKEDGK